MAPTGLGFSAAGHSSPSSSSQIQPAPPPPSSSITPAVAAVEVEMSNLEPSTGTGLVTDVSINSGSSSPSPSHVPTSTSASNMAETNTRTVPASTAGASFSNPNSSTPEGSGPPVITRLDSVAIGPSTDIPPTPIIATEAGPVLVITLLLTSGARHPYKIDEKYLTKRNVNIKDPYAISVYTLKELILREWREEWEAKPSSPTSIRLIYFGRLLDDKTALKECKFNSESANVIHMTVRPQDIVDEEDASKSKTLARDRESNENTAGCRCVIL